MTVRIMIAEDQTMVRKHEPDVAVLEIEMAALTGIEVAQQLGARNRAEAVQIAQQKGWL